MPLLLFNITSNAIVPCDTNRFEQPHQTDCSWVIHGSPSQGIICLRQCGHPAYVTNHERLLPTKIASSGWVYQTDRIRYDDPATLLFFGYSILVSFLMRDTCTELYGYYVVWASVCPERFLLTFLLSAAPGNGRIRYAISIILLITINNRISISIFTLFYNVHKLKVEYAIDPYTFGLEDVHPGNSTRHLEVCPLLLWSFVVLIA